MSYNPDRAAGNAAEGTANYNGLPSQGMTIDNREAPQMSSEFGEQWASMLLADFDDDECLASQLYGAEGEMMPGEDLRAVYPTWAGIPIETAPKAQETEDYDVPDEWFNLPKDDIKRNTANQNISSAGYKSMTGEHPRLTLHQPESTRNARYIRESKAQDNSFCGQGDGTDAIFANPSSSCAYKSMAGSQPPSVYQSAKENPAAISQNAPNGHAPARVFAGFWQPGFIEHSVPDGPNVKNNLMGNNTTNELDAHSSTLSLPTTSSGFVSFFVDEAAFLNRKASQNATRLLSDYPYEDVKSQHEIVERIYQAIKNTEDVKDSDKVASKFHGASIPDEDIQILCWEIMLKCRDSQESGRMVAKYHGTKHSNMDSFMARIDSVIETLKKSKAVCRQALAPSFIDRLVDQPEQELKRKCCNQKLNNKKTGQNKAGQQAIAKSMADTAGTWIQDRDGDFEYEDDQYTVASQPTANSATTAHESEGPSESARPRKRARHH